MHAFHANWTAFTHNRATDGQIDDKQRNGQVKLLNISLESFKSHYYLISSILMVKVNYYTNFQMTIHYFF